MFLPLPAAVLHNTIFFTYFSLFNLLMHIAQLIVSWGLYNYSKSRCNLRTSWITLGASMFLGTWAGPFIISIALKKHFYVMHLYNWYSAIFRRAPEAIFATPRDYRRVRWWSLLIAFVSFQHHRSKLPCLTNYYRAGIDVNLSSNLLVCATSVIRLATQISWSYFYCYLVKWAELFFLE